MLYSLKQNTSKIIGVTILIMLMWVISCNPVHAQTQQKPTQLQQRLYSIIAPLPYWQQVYPLLDSCRNEILFADGIDGKTRKSLTDKLTRFMNDIDAELVAQKNYYDSTEAASKPKADTTHKK